jgi:probable H4MPT-linked C1 transfer pathway protein
VAVTMTGELCDCFPTKRDGVRHILAAVEQAFPRNRIEVWSTAGRFVTTGEANRDHLAVAAANWHAQATVVGRYLPAGFNLLVDTGSTTTDIIPIRDRLPVPVGRTDPERLRSGELVYTGVRRTPVCAVLGSEVAAEWFATTADVYLILGLLPENADDRGTADGRPLTVEYAHARLARMLGGDAETTSYDETRDLAERVCAAQRRAVASGIHRVLEHGPGPPGVVVLSGSGETLALVAWLESKPDTRSEFFMLSQRLGPGRSAAACAYAVAVLAAERPA